MVLNFIFGAMAAITIITMRNCLKQGHGSFIDLDTPICFMLNLIGWLILIIIYLLYKVYGGN